MKRNSFKTIFIILVVFLLGFALYNNVFKERKEEQVEKATDMTSNSKNTIISDDIRIGIIEFDNINPILSNNKNVQDISRLIFSPLFNLTEDYKLEAELAKEWTKLDEKTYLIKLKENIKWHDGNDFNASDVIFTIDMIKKKENKSVYYYNVKDISAIEEIDEYTIKISTNNEIPYFEYNFIFPIVSSKYFDEKNFLLESKNIKPVGTGKFYISDTSNNSILLKRNINNFETDNTKIDTITVNLYDSLSSVINSFRSGEIDIFVTSNLDIQDYLKNVNYNKVEYINRTYNYIALNSKSKILSNIEVRQAINSAINKEEIIKRISNGKYKKSDFPLDFGSYAYDKNNNSTILYDKNTAKKLLLNNGWKYSSKKWKKVVNHKYLKIELNLVTNKTKKSMTKVANNIKDQLRSVGIIVNVIEANDKEYKSYLKKKNYDMIIISSNYGYSPSLNKYFQNSNFANYNNKEVVKLLDESKNISDDNELKQNYKKISEIYNNDVPYISLYFDTSTMICTTSLKGNIKPNSYNLFYGLENWHREYVEKK